MIAPKKLDEARRAIIVRPVAAPTAAGRRKLAASMRRLGADAATVAKLTGQSEPAAPAAPAT